MSFKEYLQSKKIDPKSFAQAEPEQFREFKALFDQVHPASFTAQKLFVINAIRRKYPLVVEVEKEAENKEAAKVKIPVPKVKIQPKNKE